MSSIQQAECVLLPYLSATQSGVLAAAYAGRRYVIASDTLAASPTWLWMGITACLSRQAMSHALVGAVKRLAADPALRARLQKGAQETADTTLSWRRIVDEANPKLLAVLECRRGR